MQKNSMKADFIPAFWNSIPENIRACFVGGLISGLITHFYMISNKLPNWDDLYSFEDGGVGSSLGRWLSWPVHDTLAKYSSPAIHGTVGILFLCLAACFVVSALKIDNVTTSVLIGVMLVTFPSVASIMTYMFMMGTSGIAILMAVLAVWLTNRYRFGWILGAVILTLSLGIYQAFYAVAASLMLMVLLMNSLKNEVQKDAKTELIPAIRGLIMLGLAIVLYMLVVKIGGWEMLSYRGADSMGSITLSQIPVVIARAYHRVLQYYITDPFSFTDNALYVFNVAIVFIGVAVLVILLIHKYKAANKRWFSLLLTLVFTLLLPLGYGIFYVMANTVEHASTVMSYSYAMVYVTVIALADLLIKKINADEIKASKACVFSWAAFILAILICWKNYQVCNEAYFRMQIAYERVNSYYNRLVMRMEEEGYQIGEKYYIAGDIGDGGPAISFYDMRHERYDDFEGVATEFGLMTEGVRTNFLRIYLGVTSSGNYVTEEEKIAIEGSSEYQEMPIYPAEGCVKLIGDTWVIRIGQ